MSDDEKVIVHEIVARVRATLDWIETAVDTDKVGGDGELAPMLQGEQWEPRHRSPAGSPAALGHPDELAEIRRLITGVVPDHGSHEWTRIRCSGRPGSLGSGRRSGSLLVHAALPHPDTVGEVF